MKKSDLEKLLVPGNSVEFNGVTVSSFKEFGGERVCVNACRAYDSWNGTKIALLIPGCYDEKFFPETLEDISEFIAKAIPSLYAKEQEQTIKHFIEPMKRSK